MKLHTLILVGFGLFFAGCAEKAPPEAEQAPAIEPAMEEAAEAVDEATDAVEEAANTVLDEAVVDPMAITPEKVREWVDAGFIDHMHMHAEQLDDLNFALADGDLEQAKIPANWLATHKTVRGLPQELDPYLSGMREAAKTVAGAEDIETARLASQEIGVHCVACHTAAGVKIGGEG
ncbi:MAG: hypothetical protein QNJ05_12340 [Woeseiaceae bacterium]|nr:hypothetical protein [Woeseiaceae bacterium]